MSASALPRPTAIESYWKGRSNFLYYQAVKILIDALGQSTDSILDVGTGGCPYLEWYPHIRLKVSVDLKHPYTAPGVKAIKANFMDWEDGQKYDVVTCLQVLEHVPDADLLAKKLLSTGKIVIVSVPFKWRHGRVGSHIHDPVDQDKMKAWFGRDPNYEYICTEISHPADRLIQVYEKHGTTWTSLKHRAKEEAAGWPPDRKSAAKSPRRAWLRRNPLGKHARRLTHQLRGWNLSVRRCVRKIRRIWLS